MQKTFRPRRWDERPTLPRYHPNLRPTQGAHLSPFNGGPPAMPPWRLPGEPNDTPRTGFQPVAHPLLAAQTRYFPVHRCFQALFITHLPCDCKRKFRISPPGRLQKGSGGKASRRSLPRRMFFREKITCWPGAGMLRSGLGCRLRPDGTHGPLSRR